MEHYGIKLHHVFARVQLLQLDESISDTVNVRRLHCETGADFMLEIRCDGVNEDSAKDINYRKVALKFLRGAINPLSELYLEVLVNPGAQVARGGKQPPKRQDGASVYGTVLSVVAPPAAAASPAAPSSSTGAAASSIVSASAVNSVVAEATAAVVAAAAAASLDGQFDRMVAAAVQKQLAQFAAMQNGFQPMAPNFGPQHPMGMVPPHMAFAAHGMCPSYGQYPFPPPGAQYQGGYGHGRAGSGAASAAGSAESQGAAGALSKPSGGGWPSWDQSPSQGDR
jgi:hypothetical protein